MKSFSPSLVKGGIIGFHYRRGEGVFHGRIPVRGACVQTLLFVDGKRVRRLQVQCVLAHRHVLELHGGIPLRLSGRRNVCIVLFVSFEFHLRFRGELHGVVAHDEVGAPAVLQAGFTQRVLGVTAVHGVITGHERSYEIVLWKKKNSTFRKESYFLYIAILILSLRTHVIFNIFFKNFHADKLWSEKRLGLNYFTASVSWSELAWLITLASDVRFSAGGYGRASLGVR